MPKKLKLVEPGFAGYTGPIGVYDFVDGVSVIEIPRAARDRLAATMRFVEIDAEGEECPAGITYRMATERARQAELVTPLARMTEAEKRAEALHLAHEAALARSRKVYSREELERILSEGGVEALRQAGNSWNVKARGAVELLEKVLAAQAEWSENSAARHAAMLARIEADLPPEEVVENETAETVDDETAAVLEAALSGDLATAITEPGPAKKGAKE